MYFVLVFCVFPIALANEESCLLPNRLNGICKPIKNCDILLRIVAKSNRTVQDERFLRQSQCGFDGGLPKVCCPDSDKFPCRTPDGNTGECIGIQSCPYLLEMLRDPNNTSNVLYVKSSACVGPEDHSVCCGPPQVLADKTTQMDRCETTVSAFPPDPESNCCGVDETVEYRIIRGSATYVTQYPWLVIIEYIKGLEKPKLLCGGFLISGKYVLTAAHCVTGAILRNGTPKNVRIGEYNLTNDGPDCEYPDTADDCTDGMILVPIEEIIPHPEYETVIEKHHDIALIRLKITAPYTDYIRPICLPKTDYELSPPNDFVLHVAGWGRFIQNITDKANIFRSSDVKRHVQLPHVSRDKCQAAIRTLQGAEDTIFTEGHICAGGDSGQGSCKGDSGGPLMYNNGKKWRKKYEAVGILSIGTFICGQKGIPSVFTYVYKYLPWIKANIKP